MKTKELIRLLQEADPTGEEEVCVNNEDILDVGTEPAYWDGTLQILERDEKLSPYYNVVGATFKREGCKVSIFTHGIRDAIHSHVSGQYRKYGKLKDIFPVKVIGGGDFSKTVQYYHDEAVKVMEIVYKKKGEKNDG